jgi:hypothetical protein
MDTTLHPPPTRVHNSLGPLPRDDERRLHGHEKNAKNGRKEPEHLLFPIFGFLEASRVRFPKPISVSHFRDNRDEMFTTDGLRVIDDGTDLEMAALDRRMKMEKKRKNPGRTPTCVGQATTRTNRKSQDQLTTEHNFYL